MIELRIEPVVRAMASLAGHGKLACRMVRIRSVQVVGLVAGVALRRHGLELAVSRVLVAGIAIDRGVGSGQRETVVVILNLLNRDLPSSNRVTLLAVRPQLTPVDVRVTVLAARADITENWFHVALRARD